MRLKGVHVSDPIFRQAVLDFSEAFGDDCWPPGHEAAGLPMDGYMAIVDPSGYRLKCAMLYSKCVDSVMSEKHCFGVFCFFR